MRMIGVRIRSRNSLIVHDELIRSIDHRPCGPRHADPTCATGARALKRNDDHWTLEEELRGVQDPTQVSWALKGLEIERIDALSPQARIESSGYGVRCRTDWFPSCVARVRGRPMKRTPC